ncbi:hypothetical protein SNEBB_005577 [Seison nebaliae]|nr:hypothetical protein SNEBB_005577 [Seison nebaliae]
MHFWLMLCYLSAVVITFNKSIRVPCCCRSSSLSSTTSSRSSSSSSSSDNDNPNIFGRHLPSKLTTAYKKTKIKKSVDKLASASFTDRENAVLAKIEEKLPTEESIDKIKNDVLNFKDTRQSIFIPNNLIRSPICSDPQSTTASYNGYRFQKFLGVGAQGQVVLLRKGNDQIALKKVNKLTDFLAQINSLIALTMNDYKMKLYNIMTSTETLENYYERTYNATSERGGFCYTMTYIRGVMMEFALSQQMFNNLEQYGSKFFAYKFLILILRDLQLLHFSFNRYPIYHNAPIYGKYSHTLFHGDLMTSNIMVVNTQEAQPLRPLLIDVGFHMSFVNKMKNELIIQFYNKYLLADSLPRRNRKRLVVHRNQIINMMQQLDFCMFLIVILDSFHIDEIKDESPMGICINVINWTQQNGSAYYHQNVSNMKSEFKDIIMLLLSFNRPFLSYQETWLKMYQFLYQD